ncbi:hypothetical protein TNCV_4637911 [Trichonephila clavipes]|uniref:Uncharacterized protein n=1 Tax=Trichonephila clavipes TaxID=2585209 RepID=A0A8X7BIN9_TRICX|nr:hypothetical protein TNCV_4637911 [Trichonephila clavipes]
MATQRSLIATIIPQKGLMLNFPRNSPTSSFRQGWSNELVKTNWSFPSPPPSRTFVTPEHHYRSVRPSGNRSRTLAFVCSEMLIIRFPIRNLQTRHLSWVLVRGNGKGG